MIGKGTLWGKSGYNKVVGIANRLFNFLMALVFIIFSLPLMIIIGISVKIIDGGHIFYKGERLGRQKKMYKMLKFRTLVPEAEKIIEAQLLSRKSTQHQDLDTKMGPFLRDTRLDELPQLFNVLIGHMDMVGPRPVRPVIYDKFCKHLHGYDKRFLVKPGLIGYSQLFTPHSAPKRIRAYIDNHFLQKKQKFSWDVIFVSYAFFVLFKKTILKSFEYIDNRLIQGKLLGLFREKRVLERVPLKNAKIFMDLDNKKEGKIIDINEEAVLVISDADIDMMQEDFLFKMEINKRKNNRLKRNVGFCTGKIFRKVEMGSDKKNPFSYTIKYKPVSRLNEYFVHQYFLSESIIR